MKRALVSILCAISIAAGVLIGPAASAPRPVLAWVTWYESHDLDIRVLYSDGSTTRVDPPSAVGPMGVHTHAFSSWFSLSPDGQKIAYIGTHSVCAPACTSTDYTLHTINIDGTGLTPIYTQASDMSAITNPEWSPDGNKILFHTYFKRSDGKKRQPDIWAVTQTTPGLWEASPLITRPGGERWSEWSPDGRFIVYEYDPDADGFVTKDDVYATTIAVSPADGSGPHRHLTGPPGEFVTDPAFSNDGKWIAYADYNSKGRWQDNSVMIMRTDGSDVRQLASHLHEPWGLDFSPDDRFIAFGESWDYQYSRILRVEVAGPHRSKVLIDSPELLDHLPEYFPVP